MWSGTGLVGGSGNCSISYNASSIGGKDLNFTDAERLASVRSETQTRDTSACVCHVTAVPVLRFWTTQVRASLETLRLVAEKLVSTGDTVIILGPPLIPIADPYCS